jgi:hypothetical protein
VEAKGNGGTLGAFWLKSGLARELEVPLVPFG